MSKTLSSVAQQEFDSLVHQVYQGNNRLDGCCKLRTGVVADVYKFRTMGKGMANQKASQADVTPMDIQHNLVSCALENWNAPEYTDIFDQAEVNFDEKSELAASIAKALGRRKDQLLIEALDIGTFAGTVDTDVGQTGSGMNLAKILAAKEILDDNEVDEEGRIFILNAKSAGSLLATTEVSSADYNSVRTLVQGQIDTFAGFTFKFIGTRAEGGLSVAADIYDGFAYHRDAVGMAVGLDMKTEINYIAEKTSWLTNGIMKAGAAKIDPSGIVKVQATET
tara:strand:+ start:403 stop:1242 length:840 start_codon:yes stop_codon:yes gene_type:complete